MSLLLWLCLGIFEIKRAQTKQPAPLRAIKKRPLYLTRNWQLGQFIGGIEIIG
jgi:hypothetical protein